MSRRPPVVLFGPNGRRIRSSAWDASGHGRRARHWNPTTANANALQGDVETIRARSRDEVRRNAWARKSRAALCANLVGLGIRPKPRTDDEDLADEILEAFHEWAEDECDADGTSDFWGLQRLAVGAWAEGGDCFVRFRPRRASDGLSVPLQLQVLEAEMVDATISRLQPNGNVIRSGIESNAIGRRRFYWMFPEHPGESVIGSLRATEARPVPADQVLHVFHVERPGQMRGVPVLATALALLHEIREVDDADVQRRKVQSLYATFEEVPADDSESVLDATRGEDDEEIEDDVPDVTAAAGSHVLLPPGHTIKFGEPPQGGADYSDWIRVKLRAVAAGVGLTYEQVTGDLSGVNFSSIRAGLIEIRRELEQLQYQMVIHQLCRPVWRRWLQTALLAGRVRVPEGTDLRRLMRAQWQPPGWEYVEPKKDIDAAVARIRAGLSTREREAAKLGLDVEEIDRALAREQQRANRLGLVLTTDARNSVQSGGGPSASANDDDEREEREEESP